MDELNSSSDESVEIKKKKKKKKKKDKWKIISHLSIYVDNMLLWRMFLFIVFTGVDLLFFSIFLEILLLVVLFVDSFHLIITFSSAWSHIWLLSTAFTDFVFETNWLHAIVTRGTEWPSLLLELRWTVLLAISIWSSEILFTLFTFKTSPALSRLVLTYRFHPPILIIIRSHFRRIIFCTYRVQKVWIFAVSVSIALDSLLVLLLLAVFVLPASHTVGTFRVLKLVQ